MTTDLILATTEQNAAEVYIRSLGSEISRYTQRDALNVIARKLLGLEVSTLDDLRLFNWSAMRYEHTSALQTWLLSNYKPATVRRYMAAVKGTLKAAWRLNQITSDEYMRAVDLGRIEGSSPSGRMLSPAEVAALLATCGDGTDGDVRDAAILMMMVLFTCRRAEITTIQMADHSVEYKPGVDRLVLHGKGRKDREEFLQNGEREIMRDWIKLRGAESEAEAESGPLFTHIQGFHKLTPNAVYKMIGVRMKKAGITGATPHDLRRTSISNLLDVTDAMTVARIAGHSSPSTTMLYDHRNSDHIIEALGKIHLPFRNEASRK